MERRRRSEWPTVVGFALIMTAVMLVPYAAYERTATRRPGWQFTGIGSRYFRDTAYHLSFVRQARDGQFLFENKYAGAEAGGPRVFNLLFLVIGWAGRVTGADVIALFHVQRIVTAIFVLVGAYWFAGRFYADRRKRWLALVLVSTGAGLHWFQEVGPDRLAEFVGDPKLIEANTFRVLEWEVVAGVSSGLMILALALSARAFQEPKRRFWLAPGLAVLAITAVHPHDVITLGLVLVALIGVCAATAIPGTRGAGLRRDMKCLVLILVLSVPLLAYHAFVIFSDPSLRQYATHVHGFYTKDWLADYGLILAAAVIGAAAVIRRRERHRAILVVFPVVIALVLLSPWPPMQRAHFHHGLHIVLCVLAVRGLWSVGGWIRAKLGTPVAVPALAVFVIAASLSNVYHFREVLTLERPRQPWQLRDEEVSALAFLDEDAAPDDVILCHPQVAEGVPYMTGSRVLAGHPEVSPGFDDRSLMAAVLMRDPVRVPGFDPEQASTVQFLLSVLHDSGTRYIYEESIARGERMVGMGAFLVRRGLAGRVFKNGWTEIYEIDRERLSAAARGPSERPGGQP